jgi:hypothetical protein
VSCGFPTLWQRTYGRIKAQFNESLRPINAGSGRFGLATVLADTWKLPRAGRPGSAVTCTPVQGCAAVESVAVEQP